MKIHGRCLCGTVTYEADDTPTALSHCHCAMCRKAHGGAFSTHVPMRRSQFSLTNGALAVYASSAQGRREYCADCGTHILVHGQTADDSVAVPAGTFDGNPPITITSHIFVRDKVDWYEIADDLPQFDGWPPGVENTHSG